MVTLTTTTNARPSEPGNYGNEEALYILQSSMTRALQSDGLVSYPRNSLRGRCRCNCSAVDWSGRNLIQHNATELKINTVMNKHKPLKTRNHRQKQRDLSNSSSTIPNISLRNVHRPKFIVINSYL